jgi:ribonucleotide monophosphatase NagD (HAD superfamily)
MLEAALTLRFGASAPRFTPLGKPQPGLFAEAARRAGTRRLVMLGDQLETDVRGAAAFGIDSVWVGGGVSPRLKPELPRPTWRMTSLAAAL